MDKNQKKIIRFTNAYTKSQGTMQQTIAIQQYDPITGSPKVTELYKPEYFQPWIK